MSVTLLWVLVAVTLPELLWTPFWQIQDGLLSAFLAQSCPIYIPTQKAKIGAVAYWKPVRQCNQICNTLPSPSSGHSGTIREKSILCSLQHLAPSGIAGKRKQLMSRCGCWHKLHHWTLGQHGSRGGVGAESVWLASSLCITVRAERGFCALLPEKQSLTSGNKWQRERAVLQWGAERKGLGVEEAPSA